MKLLLATCVVAGVACASAGAVDYSVSAQIDYENGQKALDRRDWMAAASYFSFIERLFPYSKYAWLAELGMADVELGTEHYLEAVKAYRAFIQLHPTHELVTSGYVSFRMGEAYARSQCAH